MNTLVPEPEIPSHQGPDAQSVDPDLDVVTMVVKVPKTLAHLHYRRDDNDPFALRPRPRRPSRMQSPTGRVQPDPAAGFPCSSDEKWCGVANRLGRPQAIG
jgi:hypothetical protein